jgi:hypothetical protein
LNWLAVIELERQLILAQLARVRLWGAIVPTCRDWSLKPMPTLPSAACWPMPSLIRNTTMLFVNSFHSVSVIPAKRGQKTWAIRGVRIHMRADFSREEYGRSLADRNGLLHRQR